MVLRNTTLVPSLGLRIWPACEAGRSAGMRRQRMLLQTSKGVRKKEKNTNYPYGIDIRNRNGDIDPLLL